MSNRKSFSRIVLAGIVLTVSIAATAPASANDTLKICIPLLGKHHCIKL